MDFDYKTYVKLLSEFIISGEKITRYRDPAIKDILAPLCQLLRISRLSATVFDPRANFETDISKPYIYYENGNVDESRSFVNEEKLSGSGTARYCIYQIAGEPDWTPEELSQIHILEKQTFVLNERSYTVKLNEQMALMDSELGTYSLPFFLTSARALIEQCRITEFGAAYFNLKHFSTINESLGRDMANKTMKSFTQGIQDHLSSDECICRIGGDNFIMLFHKNNLDFVKEYLTGTQVVYGKEHETIDVTTYAGYFLITDDTVSPSDIMDRACTAYYLAKNVYKRPYLFYDKEIMERQSKIKEIESIFPSAIANEEFKVFYQPKTQLNNYQIAGAEGLCRWFRNGKIVPPGEFIPVLEGSKAICTLDFYMLTHVCRDIRRWLDEGRGAVKVSVNLSRLHLGDEGLLDTIIGIIDQYNVPHEYIEIELTETTTDVDYKELKKIVCGLREQNISTSVDDFGVGYSSLNLIREMPWNVLKIDKSFLPTREENHDPSKIKMLRHIITMSQDLGLECIVEGVETAEQVKLLKECKCYLAQGYYFDKPLPVNEFERKLDCINVS